MRRIGFIPLILSFCIFSSTGGAALADDEPQLRGVAPGGSASAPAPTVTGADGSTEKGGSEHLSSPELKERGDEGDKSDEVDEKPSQAELEQAMHSDVPIFQRLASFTTGFIFGTPIAIARRTYSQTRSGSTDIIGDSHNPILVATTSLFSLPFAIIGGPLEGVGYSLANSWHASGDEPFGKDTFSLGDMD